MAINYPIADADLIERLNSQLEEFRKLRISYVDPSFEEKQKEIKTSPKEKKAKKRSFLDKFFFSEYE